MSLSSNTDGSSANAKTRVARAARALGSEIASRRDIRVVSSGTRHSATSDGPSKRGERIATGDAEREDRRAENDAGGVAVADWRGAASAAAARVCRGWRG